MFIFIKSNLDARNLHNPIGFCIKYINLELGIHFFSNCFIKKNYKNMIKKMIYRSLLFETQLIREDENDHFNVLQSFLLNNYLKNNK